MSAAHVRRAVPRPRPKPRKVAMPKKIAKQLPIDQARANKVAGLVFGAFMLAIALVVLIALDIPAKAERSAAAAVGHAGFNVSGYQISASSTWTASRSTPSSTTSSAAPPRGRVTQKAPQALVDVAEIRDRLLRFGWVKDARVSGGFRIRWSSILSSASPRRCGRTRAARAHRCRRRGPRPRSGRQDARSAAPDRARRKCSGGDCSTLMASVPTLKPQLASATWVGGRRWDLNFQSGETVSLPEGEQAARVALTNSPGSTSRTGCSAEASSASIFACPAK